jgi:hypothetical protein
MERHDTNKPPGPDETADDVDGWTEEPGDPDVAGPAAEFVDEPPMDRPEP